MSYKEFNIYQKIAFVFQNFQVLLAIIGLVGNTLTLCVFLSKPLRKNSYSFYFRMSSIIDSIVLAHSFRHWFRVVLNLDIDLFGELFCKFGEYQPFVAASTSNWLRVLILVDRFVRIVYPNQFKAISRRSFQITAVLLIVLSSLFIHVKLPLNYHLKTEANSTTCFIAPEVSGFNYFLALINSSSSTLISCVLNAKLFSFIYLSRRKLKNKLYKPHSSIVKDRKFAVSTIALNTVSFVCQLTFCISNSLAVFVFSLDRHQIEAVFTVSLSISYVNYGSVFFVSMIMNSIFYREFLSLLRPFKMPIAYV